MLKFKRTALLAVIFFLVACRPTPAAITIIHEGKSIQMQSEERIPLVLFAAAGVAPLPGDKALVNGAVQPLDQPMQPADFYQLQLRHLYPLNVNGQVIMTNALTVGEALDEAGIELKEGERASPPLSTPIQGALTINIVPSRTLTIFSGERAIQIRSAAQTVGEALAEAGIPLIGLDASSPAENEAPPADGQIRVIRVEEEIKTEIQIIPFKSEQIQKEDVPLGQEELIQPGINGLAMVQTRIRYEDGVEVSRTIEKQTTIREPQTRIAAKGSQIVLAPVGGNVPYDYWIAVEMYATYYTPCKSGTGGCSYSTASGARAGYGVVAVDYSIYKYLAGMKVYIPGYGVATIGDTGGGPIIETALGVPRTKWIDLGFNDGAEIDMTGWVTVYFLAPAPPEVPYFLK